jgi:hypothetical protein
MPTYTGHPINDAVAAADPNASANVTLARTYTGSPAKGGHDTVFSVSATVTEQPFAGPVVGAPVTGVVLREFLNDWYYRIHVIPGVLDLGNLVSDQGRTVQIWNAFFESVELTAFSATGLNGLSVSSVDSVTPPATLGALRLLTYDVTVLLAGPPTIDAELVWTIDGVQYNAEITGRRVVAFPFPPNWSSPVNETLSFRSTSIRSQDGSVQTASIRKKARRIFDYSVLLQGGEAQRAENVLFGWQHRLYAMPVWVEQSSLEADVLAGGSTLSFDPTYRSFAVGGLLALFESSARVEIREIESIVGGTITLTAGVNNTWAAGSKVFPVFVAAINPSISGTRLTDNVLQMPIRFTAEPTSTQANTSGSIGGTYRGIELTLERPNWAAGLGVSWNSDTDLIDLEGPTFALSGNSGFSEVRRDHNWWKRGYAEIAEFRGWLARRGGQAVPFYMPSGVDDFRLVNDVLSTDTGFDVTPNDYDTLVDAHPARRDILIQFNDGSHLGLRISSAATSEEGNTRLVFTVAIGRTFTRAEVKRISYLSLYRLVNNDISLSWQNNQFVIASATLVNNRTT